MQKIAILYDASQAVLSTFEQDEVLNQILAIVRDYFHLENIAVLLMDDGGQTLSIRNQLGRDANSAGKIPVGKGLTGTAAKLKRPVYAPDVSKDARYICSIPSTRSELAIPLMVRDEVVGVLDCQSDQENFFDKDTIDLLALFSTQASIALENARLYSLERRRAAQLSALNTIAQQTTSMLDLAELLDKVCSLILEAFPVDHVTIMLKDEEDKLLMRAHAGKLTRHKDDPQVLAPGKGLSGRALNLRKTIIENDVSKAQGYVNGFEETRSEMCVPLISFGEPLGVLVLDSAKPDAFHGDDVQALISVADICATNIQNAHSFDSVKQMAYKDGLTGVFNRRYFEMRIAEELDRASRYQNGMAIIMVDIDHFKKLNDEFGHLLGDEVLRQVSQIFGTQLRKADILCRYGGEEFVIMLPETSGEGALAVAEKLRRVVEAWHFPGVPRPVTISLGVADYPNDGQARDALVRSADEALYHAKQAGRNRVMSSVNVREASAD